MAIKKINPFDGEIHYLTENYKIMSKEKTVQKSDKKKAEKTLKEKRADKKAKKSTTYGEE